MFRERICEHCRPALTRRDVLVRAANGFGAIALGSLLPPAHAAKRVNPLAPKPPNFPPKTKSVIFLFMVGAPSHVDTFDPKPALEKYDGQLLPPSYGTIVSEFTKGDTPLLKSPWKFHKFGQCGREVSTLFPHLAQCVDDLCFVRSFDTESTLHAPAMYQVNTGRILMGYPSMGSCTRSEEHTSELQSPDHLVCRLLLEKKKNRTHHITGYDGSHRLHTAQPHAERAQQHAPHITSTSRPRDRADQRRDDYLHNKTRKTPV